MKMTSFAQLSAPSILLCSVLTANALHAAADAPPRISVVFVNPDNFTDVGYSEAERGSRAILLQLQRFIVETGAVSARIHALGGKDH
jgi:hypothetical protein